MGITSRGYPSPIVASIFAGFIGAAIADALITSVRAPGSGALGSLLVLAVGLHGTVGLLAAASIGTLSNAVWNAVPGGARGLRTDERRDSTIATGILGAALGVVAMAAVVALGHKIIVRPMQSDKLATIAVAGLVLAAAPVGGSLAVASLGWLGRWVTPRVPRPASLGRSGALLVAGAAAGILAALGAFSRADWRVLDLAPFIVLAIAVAAGTAHALFWYGSGIGRRLGSRLPVPALAVFALAVLLVVAALVRGASLPGSDPAFRAAEEGSLGLRMALRLARAATDRDGDTYSARFGGGDCDDARAEVYPGAEDIPGNQIDENCEGGDATAVAEDEATGAEASAVVAAGEAEAPAPSTTAKTANPTPSAQGESGSGGAGAAAPGSRSPPFKGNILIVTIDALRADRLGVAGYNGARGGSLTPNLDRLARRGAYFKRVWSQAPNTPRSFPAILTSQYPTGVKWDKPAVNYPLVLPANHSFFEDLSGAGLTPIGIFSHFYFTNDRGISKGFKEWSNDGAGTIAESNKDSASPRIVPRVVARLKQARARRERFVLWTHLFEPHSSYMPHREFPPSGVGGVPGLMDKYDNEIAFVDLWVGKLLGGLDQLGLSDSTAVVIMADHGEAWGEHKSYFHGQDLFDEQLRIPLIIAIPGRPALVSDVPVAAVDLAPTLVDLVGAPVPKSFRGRSLLPLLEGQSLPPRPIYGELMPATAWPHQAAMMIDGDQKIIHRVSERRWELYDLARDPGETRNLADDPGRQATFAPMRARLLSFEERPR